jgi:hypothetical protein
VERRICLQKDADIRRIDLALLIQNFLGRFWFFRFVVHLLNLLEKVVLVCRREFLRIKDKIDIPTNVIKCSSHKGFYLTLMGTEIAVKDEFVLLLKLREID